MSLSDLTVMAAETAVKAPPTIPSYAVGGLALGILLTLLVALLVFGAGREHS